MAVIRWTTEAECWLKDIFAHIARDSENAARKVVSGIFGKAQELRYFPLLGYRYEEVHDRDVRILLYGHYRIAYIIKTDGDIDILGVFHGALDIHQYLI